MIKPKRSPWLVAALGGSLLLATGCATNRVTVHQTGNGTLYLEAGANRPTSMSTSTAAQLNNQSSASQDAEQDARSEQ